MEIEGTKFGSITIDRKAYEHDVVIRLSGEVIKRKKKLSKKYYGTSHVLSKDEAKFVFEKGCEELIIGSGQIGNVHLSPEAEAYFAKKGCKVLLQPTPEAITCSTNHMQRRLGFFTSPVENITFQPSGKDAFIWRRQHRADRDNASITSQSDAIPLN